MAYLDLDKIINISWGGGWTYPDGTPYPVLNQSIWLFNKPNAWDTDSQGWFGLLNSSNNDINAENQNFQDQFALSIMQWTWPLSSRVKSYDFSTNISTIDGGRVVAGLYLKPETVSQNILRFNSTNPWEITTATICSNSVPMVNLTYDKWYIATSPSWNKFLVYWTKNVWEWWDSYIYSIPLDLNLNVSWVAIQRVVENQENGNSKFNATNVIAAIWEYVRVITNWWDLTSNTSAVSKWQIYSIADDWTLTIVDSQTFASGSTPYNTSDWWNHIYGVVWSYTDWATCWVRNQITIRGRETNGTYHWVNIWKYIKVDLTNTWTFTYTDITWLPSEISVDARGVPVYYDWTNDLIYWIYSTKDIYSIDNSGTIVNVWQAFDWEAFYSSVNLSWSISKLTDHTNRVTANDSLLDIFWENADWTRTILYKNIINAYEIDWSITSDAWYKSLFINNDANNSTISLNDNLWITLNVNSSPINREIKGWINFSSWKIEFTDFSALPTLNSPSVELELSTTNVNSRDIKMWFNLTWWDYSAPTGSNDLSWNATTAWSAWSNATYLNLTLST